MHLNLCLFQWAAWLNPVVPETERESENFREIEFRWKLSSQTLYIYLDILYVFYHVYGKIEVIKYGLGVTHA